MSRVVGSRALPAEGDVEVWIDTGSAHGYVTRVPASWLRLDPLDNGQTTEAVYSLHPPKTARRPPGRRGVDRDQGQGHGDQHRGVGRG